MDPIAAMVFTGGEPCTLKTPAATAGYDPTAGGDYTPNAPASQNFKGFQSDVEEEVVGADLVFTIQAASRPAGLVADQSLLTLRGHDWRVVKFKERRALGKINGYTLFLAT